MRFTNPFVPAPMADVFWLPELVSPVLHALIEPADPLTRANFVLSTLAANVTISILCDGNGQQLIVLKSPRQPLLLVVTGTAHLDGPARITFFTRGVEGAARAPAAFAAFNACLSPAAKPDDVAWTPTLLRRRNALIALDGDAAGASYREISTVIVGAKDTEESWRSLNNRRKDQVRRALQRGEALIAGGYRQLLE